MVRKRGVLIITLVHLHTLSISCLNETATDLALVLLVKSARILRPANPWHSLHLSCNEKRTNFLPFGAGHLG